jgi:hypothetical protein
VHAELHRAACALRLRSDASSSSASTQRGALSDITNVFFFSQLIVFSWNVSHLWPLISH